MQFDRDLWQEKIQNPLWYTHIPELLKEAMIFKKDNPQKFEEMKEIVYSFFETAIEQDTLFLASSGKDFDAERQPIEMIVLHHTHSAQPLSKERLSAMELLRLYAPYFSNPTYKQDKEIKNTPIFSGHQRNGRQVFWPYHWIIRQDGTQERLLNNEEVGWHCGDWDINCKSIAIAFDNDFENSTPSEIELKSLSNLIHEQYPNISEEQIVGHCEINTTTNCPSKLFLGEDGWKKQVTQLLNS